MMTKICIYMMCRGMILEVENISTYTYIFWHSSHFVHRNSRLHWFGFMLKAELGEHHRKATTFFLPILDLNPNDMRLLCAAVWEESDKTGW